MTAELEHQMDRISEGELRRDEVVAESQQMLEEAWKRLDESVEEVRAVVLEALRREQTLGICTNCGGELVVVVSKKSGKRFAACRGKPDEEPVAVEGEGPARRGCGQTYPLPPFGQVVGAGKVCPACGLPMIRVVGTRGSREQCIDFYGCPSNQALHERRAQRRAAPDKS
jgi:DNA topoisomerase-1